MQDVTAGRRALAELLLGHGTQVLSRQLLEGLPDLWQPVLVLRPQDPLLHVAGAPVRGVWRQRVSVASDSPGKAWGNSAHPTMAPGTRPLLPCCSITHQGGSTLLLACPGSQGQDCPLATSFALGSLIQPFGAPRAPCTIPGDTKCFKGAGGRTCINPSTSRDCLCHGSDAPRRTPQQCPMAAIPRELGPGLSCSPCTQPHAQLGWHQLAPGWPQPHTLIRLFLMSQGKWDREKDNKSHTVCSLLPHTLPKVCARLKGTSVTMPWEGTGSASDRCVPAPLWLCGTGWVTLAPHTRHRALCKALLTPANSKPARPEGYFAGIPGR